MLGGTLPKLEMNPKRGSLQPLLREPPTGPIVDPGEQDHHGSQQVELPGG